MSKTIIVWDVDTQQDFFDSEFVEHERVYKPALAVPGAGAMRQNMHDILSYASNREGYRIMGSVDAHTYKDKKHFEKWPVHCRKETPGQLKIPETRLAGTKFIPMDALTDEDLEAQVVNYSGPVYFEKRERPTDTDADACNSCRVNENVAPALEAVEPGVIAVTGVVLGYCVKEAVDYFLELGYKVAIVTDAVKEFAADELALYAGWKNRGVMLLHTRDVLAGKLEVMLTSSQTSSETSEELVK